MQSESITPVVAVFNNTLSRMSTQNVKKHRDESREAKSFKFRV